MQFLPLFGLGLFAIASFIIGLRLIVRAGSQDRLPALLIGIAFLAGGGLGQPLTFVGIAIERGGSSVGVFFQAVGFVFLDVGAVALWAFTWRVFRPTAPWATGLVTVAFAALAASFVAQATSVGFSLLDHTNPWFWLGFGARALAAGWAAFESLRYYELMRRRLALGLAEPLATHRFLLWGLSATAVVLLYGVNATAFVIGGSAAATSTPTIFLATFLGLEAATSMWLAFFPPASYRARFEVPGPMSTAHERNTDAS